MAVTINAKGTSVQAFTIGKAGTTLYQQSEPLSPKGGDIWFDKDTFSTKVYNESTSTFEYPRLGEIGFDQNAIISLNPDGTLDTDFSKPVSDDSGNPELGDILIKAHGDDSGLILASDSTTSTLKVANEESLYIRGGNSVDNQAGSLILRAGRASGSGFDGDVFIQGMKFPKADGTDGQVLTTNGSGQLRWADSTGGVPTPDPVEIPISNSGFESDFTDWDDVDPSSISTIAYAGTKSAKLSGAGASVTQTVVVPANADLELSCWVLGNATVGADLDGDVQTTTGTGIEEWHQVSLFFNSGTSTSIQIFAEYYNEEGRVDDFKLIQDPVVEASVTISRLVKPADGASVYYDEFLSGWRVSRTVSNDITISGIGLEDNIWPEMNKLVATISDNIAIAMPTTLNTFEEYEVYIENISTTNPNIDWGPNVVWNNNRPHRAIRNNMTKFKLFTTDAGLTWNIERTGRWG